MPRDLASGAEVLSPDDLLNARETADYLAKLLHSPVAVRTLSIWPLAYRRVGHHRLYHRADVEVFAKARLANAPRNIGKPPKLPPRPPFTAPIASEHRPLRQNQIKAGAAQARADQAREERRDG
jgi:hypothetical protein